MRILIFGKTGQVARELSRLEWPRDSSIVQLDRDDCDLRDINAIRHAVTSAEPDLVVNVAAYTAVDRAEAEPETAYRINRDAPHAMACACAEANSAFIHLSTDYVFDGQKTTAYSELDETGPLSVYGCTKAEGEAAVRASLERHIILRTSWVFSAHGTNFLKTMLRLARIRPELRVVADQHGAPTSARDIAEAVRNLTDRLGESSWGTFHFTSAEPSTWFDFARAIFSASEGLEETTVVPIATKDYPTAAERPRNSVLDCNRIGLIYGIRQPSWRQALADVLLELEESQRS